MSDAINKAMEAAGWRTGDAADLLDMTEEQRTILDLRVQMAKAVRQRREEQDLTQSALATKLKSTQPRVAKIEAAAPDVSFDQLIRALVALGYDLRLAVTTSDEDHEAYTLSAITCSTKAVSHQTQQKRAGFSHRAEKTKATKIGGVTHTKDLSRGKRTKKAVTIGS